MRRDLLVSCQVTWSGHLDGDRKEEVPEIDLGGEGPAWSRSQDTRSSGPGAHFKRRDPEGVVAWGPSSGSCTCLPGPLPRSRSGNGLGPLFILRSRAFPSQSVQALSNSCQLSPYQGLKVSLMASLLPGLSLSLHWAVMLCLRYVYGSGHACTHSVHTAPQAHIGKGAWGGRVIAGVFEDCCLAYHPHIRLTVLRRAQYYLRQDVSGSCNLPAVM